MINVRPAQARGATSIDWLDSRHTFSFGDFHDPRAMGFRVLRVLNDDRITPGAGFPTHAHRDMEIVSYVLEGALAHKDSLGTGSIIRPGDVQRMSAGTGVRHSEFNASAAEPAHFLQIWILPERAGLPASYQQKTFPPSERRGKFRLVASRDGRDGSVTIHQDCAIWVALLEAGERVSQALPPGRFGYLHVARGGVTMGDLPLGAGDGAEISDEASITATATAEPSEILLFELP